MLKVNLKFSFVNVRRKNGCVTTFLYNLHKSNVIQLALFISSILLIFFIDRTDYIPYFYTICLLLLIGRFVANRKYKKLFFYYNCYFIIAVIFTIVFKNQFPLHLGTSGPGEYGGLDDARFFGQIVYEQVSYTVGGNFNDSPFAIFLRLICLYEIKTPLNVVTLTVSFSALLPIYYEKLSYCLFHDRRVSALTSLLVFVCPFTMFFGCVLLRDIFTAMLVAAGLFYYYEKKYLPLLICGSLIAFVRLGTLTFLLVGLLVMNKEKWKVKYRSNLRFYLTLSILIGVFYLFYGYVQTMSGGRLSDGFIRETGDFFANSTIGAISKLPFPLNIIGGTIFFFFIPLLSFSVFKMEYGIFHMSSLFQGFLTPIFMFFLWTPIFSAIITQRRKYNKNLSTLILCIICFCFLLGTISLQSRHKTVLFPMLCMLAAYGHYNSSPSVKTKGRLIAICLILSQIALVVRTFI